MKTKFRVKLFKSDFKTYLDKLGIDLDKLKKNYAWALLVEYLEREGLNFPKLDEVEKNDNHYILIGWCEKQST